MKAFPAQSYYELLEISVSASAAEVRAAWERLTRMYSDDQLALYGLANADTAARLRVRLREAMEVLSDDELRAMYDEEIGLPPRGGRDVEEPEPAPVANQLEMGELLAGADHSIASTHPRVAFTYSEPVSAPAPLTPAPVVVAPPAPPPPAAAPQISAPTHADAERLSGEGALSLLSRPSPRPPAASAPVPDRPRLPDIPPDAEYNGELLRKVRTALGLSLATVAERTRIGAKHLENVEADRYDALPAAVYLRGILMSLARELRLDGLKVSKSYMSLVERIRAKG